ncbi:MAG: hypothetical protein IT378_18640 [Sandaracinaceae bacterium]|nr:hypothetical protein [Sandaracinaceae bacterium]
MRSPSLVCPSPIGSALLCAWCLASIAQAQLDDPSVPLSDAERRAANDVPDEHTPSPGEHYPVSNEWRHDLWFPHIRDLGGAFVGVGSDQCYTLAAIQNARVVWVVDFDPVVPIVHRLYGVLVGESESPDALVARFSDEGAPQARELFGSRLRDRDLQEVLRVYERNRERMHGYLSRVRRGQHGPTWLSDPALYARVRALHRNSRIIARNGDVTANGALRAVGRVASQLGVAVRVLDLSNAEQFFPWGADFRANFTSLPSDERSVVLRTFRDRRATYPAGDRWHYVVQPASDMRARIDEAGYRHSRQLVIDLVSGAGRRLGRDGVTVLDASVPRRAVPRAARASR